jgi:hypothetical protein
LPSGACGFGGIFSIRFRTSSLLVVAISKSASKTRHPKVTRRVPKRYSKQVAKHAKATGTLLWAWNRLHQSLADAFGHIVSPEDMAIGLRVWAVIRADLYQREMLRALLAKPGIQPDVAEALEWLIDVANKLSEERNDLAHTALGQVNDGGRIVLIPDMLLLPGKFDEVMQWLKKDRKKLVGDIIALSFYARDVVSHLMFSEKLHRVLIDRPTLRFLPRADIPKTRSQKKKAEQREARRRAQRRASLAKPQNLSRRGRGWRDARIKAAQEKQKGKAS